MRLLGLSVAVALLLSVAASRVAAQTVPSVPADALALVAGEPIPLRLFNQELHRTRRSYELRGRRFPRPGTAAHRRIRDRIVERLVYRAELRQKAKRDLGIDVSPEQVDFQVDQIRQQWGANEAQFRRAMTRLGLTEELLRADAHARITFLAIADAFRARASVSDDEVVAYYTRNVERYRVPAARDVWHIRRGTRASAVSIRRAIVAGASFGQLARRFSLDRASGRRGGFLTVAWRRPPTRFTRVAFSLRLGALSRPFRTSSGWHLVRAVSAVRPPRTTPLSEVFGAIRQQLRDEEAAMLMTVWLQELRAEYADKVVYQAGFEPSE